MYFSPKVRVEDKDEIKLISMELSLPLKISTDLMQDAVTQQWKKVYKMLIEGQGKLKELKKRSGKSQGIMCEKIWQTPCFDVIEYI